ncbi:hypothetical protein [Streptomyces lydicus]|uniref:hypothetical protein n=1 Tax=Streptomyces lydicus TaxID=47763 RepID=UPI001012EA61|nr:hypothetical protein [Streptomyces lydicus]MCZ1012275.1 hypothetical protein [Streptomyces lydicus]
MSPADAPDGAPQPEGGHRACSARRVAGRAGLGLAASQHNFQDRDPFVDAPESVNSELTGFAAYRSRLVAPCRRRRSRGAVLSA